MAKRFLVTGGCGFIGSHVVEALIARGDEVICVDNFDDFYAPEIKRRNVAALEQSERFQLLEGDIRDAAFLEHVGRSYPLDAVVHLAARAGVRPSIRDPALYADVNLRGTSNVLELARRFEIGNFVFASSSSVYGERKETPFRESDPVDHPVSPYAATKKGGELLCYTYHHLYDMAMSCLRFFTVYGPRQRPEMAIHKFTRLIDAGEPLPMYGEGDASRDYTYVDDIVEGVLRAIDRNRGYSIYNLGNHRMVSLREMIETIGRALGKEPRIEEHASQAGDVSITCADITRARLELGYEPRTPFADGIAKFTRWYRENGVGT